MASDPLSATFAALADPTRRAILARLASGERSVTELAEPFDMTMPAVTKHLKVLEKAGLITRGKAKQWRPCTLKAQPLQDVAGWLEQYRQFWEQRMDRLEAYLQALQIGEQPAQPLQSQQLPDQQLPNQQQATGTPTAVPARRDATTGAGKIKRSARTKKS